MENLMLRRLSEAGNNIAEYVERFEGDEATCETLTEMFTGDTTYFDYFKAYEAGDMTLCREHIHGLKGLTANIGLSLLSAKSIEIMKALDNEQTDRLPVLNDELRDLYDTTVRIISGD